MVTSIGILICNRNCVYWWIRLFTTYIAQQLALSCPTVRKSLQQDANHLHEIGQSPRTSKLDAYRRYLKERLQRHPELSATRLLRESPSAAAKAGIRFLLSWHRKSAQARKPMMRFALRHPQGNRHKWILLTSVSNLPINLGSDIGFGYSR